MIGRRGGFWTAVVLLTSSILIGACVVQGDVKCYELSNVDCGRAVALARSVLADRRSAVTEFFASDGACGTMRCPDRVHQLSAGKFITVDITFADGSLAVIQIDRRGGEPWVARCADVVRTNLGNSIETRLEPCE